MRQATLQRMTSSSQGTFGTLATDSGFTCVTGELPWHDNASSISCIPAGTYTVTYRQSSKHGMCYHVENVPGRTGVEIHAANFMGDKSAGFRCELEGCIAPGLQTGTLNGQAAVLSSKAALNDLESDLNREPFTLTVQDVK